MRSLFTALSFAILAMPVHAQTAIPIDVVSGYFQEMDTLESSFTQINADGSLDTGTLYISRPGKMRFEYNAPNDALILASGGSLAIFDGRSNAGPERYPLSKTPFSLILDRNVNLSASDFRTGTTYESGVTVITAEDTRRPQIGKMHLSFTDSPVALRSWIIQSQSGQKTTIILGDVKQGLEYPASVFSIDREVYQRER
ncbi:LolA family protein [Pseudosulfitobacter pseudonitzschiae]|uniref:LolA family protein n=1 Tax=Pseudosulfitobacter pseudonitzschiae TaxID=1402135 RepID=UPI003B7BFC3A